MPVKQLTQPPDLIIVNVHDTTGHDVILIDQVGFIHSIHGICITIFEEIDIHAGVAVACDGAQGCNLGGSRLRVELLVPKAAVHSNLVDLVKRRNIC